MPYIAIRCYPKDEETKNKVVDEINAVLFEYDQKLLGSR